MPNDSVRIIEKHFNKQFYNEIICNYEQNKFNLILIHMLSINKSF